jgi:topoisomerase IV subunit A
LDPIDDIQDPEEERATTIGYGHADIQPVSGLFQTWFIDYASYVIMERAVPTLSDGLKPVQRRILHAMKEMDDGRFNKVANIIGATMAYHPHGDAAIGDALVNIGQKELLIETQGNWGDVRTGDSAAAPRYIEARLSKFALEVLYDEELTNWQLSYDGRKREPLTLPVRFPLVLAQGVEGIAVGLSTRIMPHNFCELCEASIDVLRGKKTQIIPDFPTAGMADFSQYNEGKKGSRIRVRARIEEADRNRLLIKEIPFSTTTGSLIESILKAADSGKIKIKKVVDNTARDVEIEVQLAPGTSPDKMIDALYAFTDCEVSISPAACVIEDDRPQFLSVNEILERSTAKTVELLRRSLQNRLNRLENEWHFSSLEKIFIENRIYRDIEECETWEAVIEAIEKGLDPFRKLLRREITRDDIIRLTEIRIKRISKFDAFKADEHIRGLENQIAEVNHHLANLTDYAIEWFKKLLKNYGKGRERKTQIRTFDSIEANVVAEANVKLYANFKEGFVGYGLKKDEFVCDCSDIDDIIAIRNDGKFMISKISEKHFFGKNLIHVDVFRKNDERTVYNVVYLDGGSKRTMVKRFSITGMVRDKEYDITQGSAGSEILYMTVNKNAEAEKITIHLSNLASARVKQFDYDFAQLAVKNRGAQGNLLTRYPVRKVELKEKGRSTAGGRKIWYEPEVGRLNSDGHGQYLGEFDGDDRILVIWNDGSYELTSYELTHRYDSDKVYLLQKFWPEQSITAFYYHKGNDQWYMKRFLIETLSVDKKFSFIGEEPGNLLLACSTAENPSFEAHFTDAKKVKQQQVLEASSFTDVKGWKAQGTRFVGGKIQKLLLLSEKVGQYQPPVSTVAENMRNEPGDPGSEGGQLNLL